MFTLNNLSFKNSLFSFYPVLLADSPVLKPIV